MNKKPAKAKPLSPAQKKVLLTAFNDKHNVYWSSDCRTEFKLCEFGLMVHAGARTNNRPSAYFKLTEKGERAAKALLDSAINEPTPEQ